ncbi:MAG: hypothetical protein IT350_12135, partial [Deltaproteobacteria bacterium]|nr:hypothetical protein [Deltaproteobacteria bacterium]
GGAAAPAHGQEYRPAFTIAASFARFFGPSLASAMAAPMLATLASILLAFALGRRLAGGDPMGGWLAMAAAALTPGIYGFARIFSPWAIAIAAFLILALALERYHRKADAISLVLLAPVVHLVLAVEQYATGRFCALGAGGAVGLLLVIDLTRTRRVAGLRLAGHGALLVVLCASVVWEWFPPGRWTRLFGHYADAVTPNATATGSFSGLFDYVKDLWYNLLHPVGVAIFGTLLAWSILARRGKPAARPWAAAPILALAVVSLIPKKMPWYILMPSALMPIVAAAALAVFLRDAPVRRRNLVPLVMVLALAVQYVLALFIPFHQQRMEANVDLYENRVRPVVLPIDRVGTSALRPRLDRFFRFLENRENRPDPVRLGLLMSEGDGAGAARFWLRAATAFPLDVHYAALPNSGDPGEELDAVLFISGPYGDWDRLRSDREFLLRAYLRETLDNVRFPGESLDEEFVEQAGESLQRRIRHWDTMNKVDLGNGVMVILP